MGKTKGSVVLHAVKPLRKQRAAALGVLPPALHHYLEERIVVAVWYPEEDLKQLMSAVATLMGGPREQVFDVIGAVLAQSHMEGLYADLKDRSPGLRAHTNWKTQHDTGTLSVVSESPTAITYELVGWDHASRDYCRAINAYLTELQRMSGDRNPRSDHTTCRTRGGDRCVWVVSREAD